MAGLGRALAEGMNDFAAGVYKGLDNGKTGRLANKVATKNNIPLKQAQQQINKQTQSQFGKIGTAAINSAPMSGIAGSAKNYMHTPQSQRSLMGSIKQGHMNKAGTGLDFKKVAGTAATVGVAGRVATGGGLYRDRYGNVNVPGLPFI